MSDVLSQNDVASALTELQGWAGDTSAIRRTVAAPDFPTAIRIVDDVAVVAEELNHHPDIDIRWKKVTFTLSTHSAGGVTEKDVELANRIDSISEQHRAS
jgi:4a-hydroxytetrahydrobiopterin dehydratase